MKQVCFNGEITTEAEISFSSAGRGLMYGDGCFDTLRAYKGKFLAFAEHYKQLAGAHTYLGLQIPFDESDYQQLILNTLESNGVTDQQVIVRTQCWRKGNRGYQTDTKEVNFLITLSELSEQRERVTWQVSEIPAISDVSLSRRYKLSNGLNYILAANSVKGSGADDALMITTDGWVSESTIANIFWISGDTIYTPSIKCDLYPGVTRGICIQLIKELGLELNEGIFNLDEVLKADAVFATNSVRELYAISRIEESVYSEQNPVFAEIRKMFESNKSAGLE